MLALAVVLFSMENNYTKSIQLAKDALKANPKYVSSEYQKNQLWGVKLQKETQLLFERQEMIKAVKEAKEKNK